MASRQAIRGLLAILAVLAVLFVVSWLLVAIVNADGATGGEGTTSPQAWTGVDDDGGGWIGRAAMDDDDDDDDDGGKVVSGRLVRPLGWLAVLLMVSASLYYSAKRSILGAVRAAEGAQRKEIGSELRRALGRHIAASIVAMGLAVLHVLNFIDEVGASLGWLTFALMLAVAASGVAGRYFLRAPGVRENWRRFHLPLTYFFFAVVALHVIDVIELIGD